MSESVRVLHIDDSAADRELIRDALEREDAGFEVLQAASREELEARLADGEYDVALCDVNIPSFESLDAIDLVRETSRDLPVIIVTGRGSETIAVEAMKRGAADYVIKTPSHIRRLSLTIQAVLEEARLEAERKRGEAALRRFEWLLSPESGRREVHEPPYGNLTELNTSRVILDSVGKELLAEIAEDYLALLGTSTAVYEINGDYALGIFSSGWCRLLDSASRRLCNTDSDTEALTGGKWQCHESCWKEASRASIETGHPVDIECRGGIHLYAVPIRAGSEIVGAMSTGWGDPPTDAETLREIADKYGVSLEELSEQARFYESRPSFIVANAKRRFETSAILIGEIVQRRRLEAETEKRERYFRSLLYSLHEDIIVIDPDYCIVDLNDTALVTTGLRREEVIGKHCFEVSHGYNVPCGQMGEECSLKRVLDTGGAASCQHEHLRADGSTVRVDILLSPLRDAAGNITHVIEAVRDFTELVKVQDALRQSEAHLRGVFRAAPTGIGVVADRVLKQVNERMCEITGYSEEELTDQNSRMLYPSDEDYEYVGSEYAQIRDHGKGTVETRWQRKDRQIIDVLLSSTALNPDDPSEGFTFAALDITERKQAEAERERLMSAIQQAAETILITDAAGTIQYVNPAFERVTGYTRKEVIGRNPRILKSGEHDDAFYKGMWETLTRGESWNGRLVNKKKDGTLYTEEAAISPVRHHSGKTINYVAVKHDITQSIRLEEQYQQAQKVESVGRLAGGVAHDLNNLLSPILGYGELLLDALGPGDARRESVDEILRAGFRARDLVRQLLAFGRKQALDYKPLDINKVIGNFQKLLRHAIREDIEIEIIPSPDIRVVMADIGQIEQVIMNLALNAADAMPEGGRLTIETARVDLGEDYAAAHQGVKPGAYVMLAVSDTGMGMDDETCKHLFEPFFSTKGEQGTGLGLATVYGIVKQHGGNIWVYSEPNRGTTLKIYLPVSEEAHVEEMTSKKPATGLTGSETILLVEDSEQVRHLVHALLERQGYLVLAAENGPEALTILASHDGPVHLLLTDVVLPGMNAKELFARATEGHPGLKVLYMSGYTDNVIAQRGVLEEGTAFIQKPFSVQILAAKVREVLEQD
jgi:two-component system cell cycle sensor histidine kinase/response regulator CckA